MKAEKEVETPKEFYKRVKISNSYEEAEKVRDDYIEGRQMK